MKRFKWEKRVARICTTKHGRCYQKMVVKTGTVTAVSKTDALRAAVPSLAGDMDLFSKPYSSIVAELEKSEIYVDVWEVK